MTLHYLIDTYGYPAIVVGTFFEGETILVLGGVAAKLDYLKLPWVILSAFAGTLCGDQLLFLIGRYKGQSLVARRPALHERADKVLQALERHRYLVILGFRFVYGMRSITPFAIGLSRVRIIEFVVLNIVSAAAWATLFGTLGYVFGNGLELVLGNIRHYEAEVFALVLIAGGVLWLIHRFRSR